MTSTLQSRARKLRLWGLLERWAEVVHEPWLSTLLEHEEAARQRRSHEHRTRRAKLHPHKLLADFDWRAPTEIDRGQIEELFTLQFLEDACNVIFLGPNGVGKTMLATNLAKAALAQGHTARFVTAGDMLNHLAACDGAGELRRTMLLYTQPKLLVLDELAYLSYGNRHADLLYEVISKRYQVHPTVVTTNKPFSEWSDSFEHTTCLVTVVDRLLHKAEVVSIQGASYRSTEGEAAREQRRRQRKAK